MEGELAEKKEQEANVERISQQLADEKSKTEQALATIAELEEKIRAAKQEFEAKKSTLESSFEEQQKAASAEKEQF